MWKVPEILYFTFKWVGGKGTEYRIPETTYSLRTDLVALPPIPNLIQALRLQLLVFPPQSRPSYIDLSSYRDVEIVGRLLLISEVG
jgi:hypothetical protein